MATQTTNDATNDNKQITQASLDAEIKKSGQDLQKEKKVKVTIPKYLNKRIGNMLPVGINGAVIYIPVDGKAYNVPEPYAAIVQESIENLTI